MFPLLPFMHLLNYLRAGLGGEIELVVVRRIFVSVIKKKDL